ncbi:MAG TPA: hypothetical protein DEV64_09585 [Rhodospirillaceae bacterium]|nr:hypothetical protein [Rhodospirillaceae bacterium]
MNSRVVNHHNRLRSHNRALRYLAERRRFDAAADLAAAGKTYQAVGATLEQQHRNINLSE